MRWRWYSSCQSLLVMTWIMFRESLPVPMYLSDYFTRGRGMGRSLLQNITDYSPNSRFALGGNLYVMRSNSSSWSPWGTYCIVWCNGHCLDLCQSLLPSVCLSFLDVRYGKCVIASLYRSDQASKWHCKNLERYESRAMQIRKVPEQSFVVGNLVLTWHVFVESGI